MVSKFISNIEQFHEYVGEWNVMEWIQDWGMNLELNLKRERENLGDSYWKAVEFRSRVLPVILVLAWCPDVTHIDPCLFPFLIITVSFSIFLISSALF